MTHYPVTTSFWRGVFRVDQLQYRHNKQLRRACDWFLTTPAQVSFEAPTCPDCQVYRGHMIRHRKIRP